MYYFDNAATTIKKPKQVGEAIFEAVTSEKVGNPARGAHSYSIDAFSAVYEARLKIASLFGASDELAVAFTQNATMALNIAIKGLIPSDCHVITTVLEHNSVLRPLYELSQRNVNLSFVNYDKDRQCLCYEEFEKLIQEDTRAIVCTQVSNVLGDIVNLEFISKLCQKYNLLFIVDGSQGAGLVPFNFDRLKVDAFCFTGHKSLYGPQGTGGLIVKSDSQIKGIVSGGSGNLSFSKKHPQELPDRLEAGTLNSHSLIGLSAGIDYVLDETPEKLWNQQIKLTSKMREVFKSMDSILLYGSDTQSIGTLALNIGQVNASDIAMLLWDDYRIAVRAGSHCAPLVHQTFKTIEQGMVRFSFSSFTTVEEIDYAIEAVDAIAKKIR